MKSPKKGDRRRIQIARAAIDVISAHGIEGLSFDLVAKRCGVVRAGVYKHFPDTESLLLFVSGLIRVEFQNMVIEQIKLAKTAVQVLDAYVLTSLDWADLRPKHVVVWPLFFHMCCIEEELSNFNRNLVNVGTQRIGAILKNGLLSGEFKFDVEQTATIARQIQILITGGLVSRPTENRNSAAWDDEKKLILSLIYKLIGVTKPI